MKLRHPRSKLTQYAEVSAPKRSFGSKLTQWIYLAVVLSVLAYVIYYIAYSMFYFNQRGLVVVNHVVISSVRGGRILQEPHSAGDHVKKGEILLRIASPNVCRQTATNKAIHELKLKNGFDKGKIRILSLQRNTKKKELKRIQYQRSMELFSGNIARLHGLQDELVTLNGNIGLLQGGLRLRKTEIKKLSVNKERDSTCQDEVIRAPADGTIISVQHKVFEVLQRTQPVMDFVKDKALVYIHAAFNNKYYNALSLGEEVQIRFADGHIGEGKIISVKSTSIPFAVDESQHYLPQRTRLLAIIEPLDSKEADLWKSFIETEVEVRGWQ